VFKRRVKVNSLWPNPRASDRIAFA